jgi:hypothetical protein
VEIEDDINKTIVVTYEEAKNMMDYTTALCGCCVYENYDKWYEKNEAYFVKSGMYIMENLMIDSDKNYHKYCFTFNFKDRTQSVFTIYNYYTQKKVCVFRYIRENNNTFEPKIIIDKYDEIAWQNIGCFMNEVIQEKVSKAWKEFHRKYDYKPNKIYNREIKVIRKVVDRMVAEFMCEHTVHFCYATMFYFSVQRPNILKIDEYEANNPKEIETFLKSGKRKYYYSGYINLNDKKLYRPKINDKLERNKRGEYERHIEKWGVRGHYRNVNGKQIWIDAHEKGKGRLENRIYGTEEECNVNIIPKVFEVDRKVVIDIKESDDKKELDDNANSIVYETEDKKTEPIEKLTNINKEQIPNKSFIKRIIEYIIKFIKKKRSLINIYERTL